MAPMERKIFDKKNGYSLVEILVGITLITLAISATVTIVFGSQTIVIDRDNTVTAQLLSKEGIVAANALIKSNWGIVANGDYGLTFNGSTWQLSGTQDTQGIFTRKINVADTGLSDEHKITSTVTWQASPLRPQKKVELVTYISNWENVLATGNDTGGGGPSSWQQPTTISTINVGSGNSVTDIDAVGTTVYVSTESTTKANKDIHAYNVTTPSSPSLLSEIDVDAYSLQSIDGGFSYIFGAATGVLPDLKIINNSNPSSLSLTSEFNVITFVDATKIFRDINTVYLGVKLTSFNGEFFTIDVTNQTSPSQKDVFEIGGNVNGIFEQNGIAYVASSKDTRELYVLNVTNPSDILQVGYLDVTGVTDGTAVFAISPSKVFLGVGNSLKILDATNPASITTLGTYDAGGTINDIYAVGNTVFLATSNSTKEFQVVNIATVSAPTLVSSLDFPAVASGIDYQNDLIFLALRAPDGLRIINPNP
ncbi:MAG: hypothetical protein RL641_374 [Candidatus Parcubacteria bacterium]|jgi:type II secretory pathway pseudopilin PulG